MDLVTSPVGYRRIYRRRTDPDGSIWAYARLVPDIPRTPLIPPPPVLLEQDVVTRIRGRAFGVAAAGGRDNVLYNTTNALLFPTAAWSTYGGILPASSLTRFPASGEGDYTVPASAANSVPATLPQFGVTSTGSSGAGTPIQNMEFFGVPRLGTLANVWFKNCRFWGTTATGALTGALEASSLNLRGALLTDCEVIVRNNNTWHTGIRGSNYIIARTEVTGASDGLSWNAAGGNVRVYGSWIHNGAYDEWAAGDTTMPSQGSNYLHCDGIQGAMGPNYYAKGCYIGGAKLGQYQPHATPSARANIIAGDDFFNSAMLLAQAANSPLLTGLVEQSVLFGGGATVNVATSNGYDLAGFEFKDNIFPYRPGGGGQWYILKPANCNCVFTNNRHPDGVAVPIVAG